MLHTRLFPGAVLLCLAAFLAGCQRGQPPSAAPQDPKAAGPPTVPDGFVLRPAFETTLGNIRAGTAFSVKLPGHDRALILTAIHLLGPSGGLPQDVPAAQVAQVVKGVAFTDAFTASLTFEKADAPIVIPEAGPLGKPSKAGDVLAFWAPQSAQLQPARLAAATPGKGERVWLAAAVREGAPPTQRLHPATVTGLEDGDLVYRFDNPQLSIRATSGAPVLNGDGEVVAINLGGGRSGKDMLGVGNPVGRFRPHLEAAVQRGRRP